MPVIAWLFREIRSNILPSRGSPSSGRFHGSTSRTSLYRRGWAFLSLVHRRFWRIQHLQQRRRSLLLRTRCYSERFFHVTFTSMNFLLLVVIVNFFCFVFFLFLFSLFEFVLSLIVHFNNRYCTWLGIISHRVTSVFVVGRSCCWINKEADETLLVVTLVLYVHVWDFA